MTGKELMLYILENNLENKQVVNNGRFLDFLTVEEAAVKFGVGIPTIYVWAEFGVIDCLKIGKEIYIANNAKKPQEKLLTINEEGLTLYLKNHS